MTARSIKLGLALLSDPSHIPPPVQAPPPIMVAGVATPGTSWDTLEKVVAAVR